MGTASLHDNGAACAHFAKGALDGNLPEASLRIENMLDFSHATPD